jgi:hypothetical protein
MCFQEKKINDIFRDILPKNPTKKEKIKLEIAKKYAIKHGCMKKARHCTIIEKNGKILAISVNVSTSHVTYTGKMSYHSECESVYLINTNSIKGANMYTVKIGYGINGDYTNSAPCHRCFCVISKLLKKKTIRKVFFSMPNGKIHSFTKNDL